MNKSAITLTSYEWVAALMSNSSLTAGTPYVQTTFQTASNME
ncbi:MULTISPECIES: hypothetical protein [unclassified Tolypothrix]|nr:MULTISPECIES: hypothetical protein [unclassified Tolypothrix]EKF03306.1 hypothetical protein FDUTEX481_02766 [Tolypothrix sp. PCC 7601]BAY93695.1 hypothetical protein NIES3275_57370 [Microchaete diplosiphon NIES-3275]